MRQPVFMGCTLCEWGRRTFSGPGSERHGISSFFPVYESLFLQACTRITRAAPQKFRPQSDVAVVGVGWRREGRTREKHQLRYGSSVISPQFKTPNQGGYRI